MAGTVPQWGLRIGERPTEFLLYEAVRTPLLRSWLCNRTAIAPQLAPIAPQLASLSLHWRQISFDEGAKHFRAIDASRAKFSCSAARRAGRRFHVLQASATVVEPANRRSFKPKLNLSENPVNPVNPVINQQKGDRPPCFSLRCEFDTEGTETRVKHQSP